MEDNIARELIVEVMLGELKDILDAVNGRQLLKAKTILHKLINQAIDQAEEGEKNGLDK